MRTEGVYLASMAVTWVRGFSRLCTVLSRGLFTVGDSTGDRTLNAAHPVALLEEAVIPLPTG